MPQVEETKTAPLNVRLSEPLRQWVEREADTEGLSVSEFVRYLLLSAKRART